MRRRLRAAVSLAAVAAAVLATVATSAVPFPIVAADLTGIELAPDGDAAVDVVVRRRAADVGPPRTRDAASLTVGVAADDPGLDLVGELSRVVDDELRVPLDDVVRADGDVPSRRGVVYALRGRAVGALVECPAPAACADRFVLELRRVGGAETVAVDVHVEVVGGDANDDLDVDLALQ